MAHRYQFKAFALDVEQLDISTESSAAFVGFMLNAHKPREHSVAPEGSALEVCCRGVGER
jgi:phosphatidylethanolamine-binding protein (PEBP) family uncharacterized protein